MDKIEKWFSLSYWQSFLKHEQWVNVAVVAVITVIVYILLKFLLHFISTHLDKWADSKHQKIYSFAIEMLGRTRRLLLFIFSLLIALKFIELPEDWQQALSHGWFITLTLQLSLWLDGVVRLWLDSVRSDPSTLRNPVTTTVLGIMMRLLVWVMALLSILGNMGVDITALIASLGVGGIAIALAIQTLLSDLFASLSIGFDKPFEIGDFVVFDDVAGTVEHIGLRTTRIRSLGGEQIVLANNILLQQTIHNYKRMEERRIVFRFGILYSTPKEQVEKLGGVMKELIENVDNTRFDRAHFLAFDDYQLTFEVVYYVTSADYNVYMDVQQAINLAMLERFAEEDVEFAFPTQTIEFAGGQLPEVSIAGQASSSSSTATGEQAAES